MAIRWRASSSSKNCPSRVRRISITSSFLPVGQEGETHIHIWNGVSEINVYRSPAASDDNVTVSRRTPSTDLARANVYLNALGLPRKVAEREQAQNGDYWLPQGVVAKNGYELDSQAQDLDGVLCRVIRRGKEDVLHFDCRDKFKLLKRDVWRRTAGIRHEVYRILDYQANGLPTHVIIDRHLPVNKMWEPSGVFVREHLRLTKLVLGAPPANVFKVDIAAGANVLDIKSVTSYRVQEANSSPFDKILRQAASPQIIRGHVLYWANLLLLGAIAVIVGLRLRKRLVAGHRRASDGSSASPG